MVEKKSIQSLAELAQAVGWRKVADDKGFRSYEYKKDVSRSESVTYLLRIFDEQNSEDFYQTLFIINNVLPRPLKKKIRKITRRLKPDDMPNVIDVIKFAIDEHKKKTTYSKLKNYGLILNVDIEKLGYFEEYETSRRKELEILAKIEAHLPMELAPEVGKIKKIEYKMAYIRTHSHSFEDWNLC